MNYQSIDQVFSQQAEKLKKLTPLSSTYKKPVARKLFDDKEMNRLWGGVRSDSPYLYTGDSGGRGAEERKREEEVEAFGERPGRALAIEAAPIEPAHIEDVD